MQLILMVSCLFYVNFKRAYNWVFFKLTYFIQFTLSFSRQ